MVSRLDRQFATGVGSLRDANIVPLERDAYAENDVCKFGRILEGSDLRFHDLVDPSFLLFVVKARKIILMPVPQLLPHSTVKCLQTFIVTQDGSLSKSIF
jgi:hypothetical protein